MNTHARVRALLWFACGATANAAENPLHLKPDHITASVTNMDRAIAWYQDMLGFEVTARGTRGGNLKFAELAIPGFGIGLVQSQLDAALIPAGNEIEVVNALR